MWIIGYLNGAQEFLVEESLRLFGSFSYLCVVLHARSDVSRDMMDDSIAVGFGLDEYHIMISWARHFRIGHRNGVLDFEDVIRHD